MRPRTVPMSRILSLTEARPDDAHGRADVSPGGIGFDAEDEVAGLPVVADGAAGEAAAQRADARSVFLGVAAHRAEVEASPVIDRNRGGGRLGVGPRGKVGGGRRRDPKRDQGGRRQQNLLHVSFPFGDSQRNYRSSQFQVACAYSAKSSQNAVAEKPHPRQMYARYNRGGCDFAASTTKQKGRREAGLFVFQMCCCARSVLRR